MSWWQPTSQVNMMAGDHGSHSHKEDGRHIRFECPQTITETEISFWRNCYHWLYRNLSKIQKPVCDDRIHYMYNVFFYSLRRTSHIQHVFFFIPWDRCHVTLENKWKWPQEVDCETGGFATSEVKIATGHHNSTGTTGDHFLHNIDGLMQERRNSTANAVELRLSCINPSIWTRHDMDTLSAFLALCEGNPPVADEFTTYTEHQCFCC